MGNVMHLLSVAWTLGTFEKVGLRPDFLGTLGGVGGGRAQYFLK